MFKDTLPPVTVIRYDYPRAGGSRNHKLATVAGWDEALKTVRRFETVCGRRYDDALLERTLSGVAFYNAVSPYDADADDDSAAITYHIFEHVRLPAPSYETVEAMVAALGLK